MQEGKITVKMFLWVYRSCDSIKFEKIQEGVTHLFVQFSPLTYVENISIFFPSKKQVKMSFATISFVLLFLCMIVVFPLDLETSVRPEEIALVQYDSRPLDDYWVASARWNKYYCDLHHHLFIYYTAIKQCEYDKDNPLASPWCKVKAMIQANEDYPAVKIFIYMDSDAVVDMRFKKSPVNSLLKTMQTKMQWDVESRPMVFNQVRK